MTALPVSGAAGISEPDPDKGWLERLLSPIADVRRGEAGTALLMALTMFLVLGGYYLLKTAREIFILSEGGAEVKSYSAAGQALLLLVIVPAYSAFASRVNRTQLVQSVTLFFAGNLVLFLLALGIGLHIGIVYFLWIGIFNVMVIAQMWAFAADLFTEEQGKRLFPLIGVGSSLGAWMGSLRAGQLVERAGAPRLLVGGALILVVCTVLVRVIDRLSRRTATAAAGRADEKLADGPSGFTLILADRYLLLIAALVLLLNVVNASGEYLFGRYVVSAAEKLYGAGPDSTAARQQFIGESYGSYFGYINLTGFLLQLFVVSRVFKWLGVGRSLFIHPIVALTSYLTMLLAPSFGAIRLIKIADNAIDYSLGNTTKQALWLPLPRETKYKAKQAIDSFCVRAGDVLQAGVVYTGELTGLTVSGFAAVNVAFACGWLAVAAGLRSRLRARAHGGREGGSVMWEFPPLSATVHVTFGAQSRRGQLRSVNEDHYLVLRLGRHQETILTSLPDAMIDPRFDESGYAMMVADGMGDTGAGEAASHLALATLVQLVRHFGKWALRVDETVAQDIMDRAKRFYRHVDAAVTSQRQVGPVRTERTTLTAVFGAGRDVFFAHVGHSRAYLYRDGHLWRLTRDHTVGPRQSERVRTAPLVDANASARDLTHILTDVIGMGGSLGPMIDIERFQIIDGDRVLVCTNGLTDMVDEEQIGEALARDESPDEQCRRLVDLAMASGGDDDVTAVVAQYHVPA